MNRGFRVPELVSSVARRMRVDLHEHLVPHPGELGTAREEVIRDFLRGYLPKRFGIDTGFVFDMHGSVSRQMDVVVYDATVCPQFETVGSKKHFPSESVVCVGEVKSVLDSAEKIGKAFENLRSVKQLDRSAGGRNLAMYTEKPIDQLSNHLDQTFAFLFFVDG